MKTLRSFLHPFKLTRFSRENAVFFQELQHFPKIVVLAIVFSLLASASEGIGIGLLLSFLQSLINPNAPVIQTGIAWFDLWVLGIQQPTTTRLFHLSGLIIVTTWLRSGLLYLQGFYVGMTQATLVNRLRNRVFDQFQQLSLSYFTQTRSGELINSLTTEISNLWIPFTAIANLLMQAMILLVYGIAIFALSWQLSLAAVLSLSLLSVGLSTLKKQVRESSFTMTRAYGDFTSVVMEYLSGVFTIHAFATQAFERKRFVDANAEIKKTSIVSFIFSSLVAPIGTGVGTTIIITLLLWGFVALNIPTARLLTFIYTLMRLVPIVQDLNRNATEISKYQGSVNNIKQLLRMDNKPLFQNGQIVFSGLKHSIRFESVDFSYGDSSLVLKNINLDIKKGQMVALVGASGSGKTTLAALIPRFYEPQQGWISIDGRDVRDFEVGSLRRKIAIVSQDTFIFNSSVRENIAYGSENAHEADIRRAAESANALEFILQMPEGFDTRLGERGVRLSGGQRQRLAIARALLRNPEILILDEATSALDSISENLIQNALKELSVNRTVIAIAHRLSTIAQAAQVVVLEQGQIVETGGYQELLAQKGKLWYYHQAQFNCANQSEATETH